MRKQSSGTAAGFCVAAALIVAGCGGEEEGQTDDTDRAIAKLERATGGGADEPASAKPAPKSAQALVRDYFELIDQDEFAEAWSYLDSAVQADFGGFESWRAGYGTNTSTQVISANVVSAEGEEDDLTVRIKAVDSCDGERFEQEFEGPFSVEPAAGKITGAEFALVSGAPPPAGCD